MLMDVDQPIDFPTNGDMSFNGLETLNDTDHQAVTNGPAKTPNNRKRVCIEPFRRWSTKYSFQGHTYIDKGTELCVAGFAAYIYIN